MVRLTDRPDMTVDVYRGRITTTQQQPPPETVLSILFYVAMSPAKTAYGIA